MQISWNERNFFFLRKVFNPYRILDLLVLKHGRRFIVCKTIYWLKEHFYKLSLKGHFRVPKILTLENKEVKCKTFVEKTSIICMRIQSLFRT